jgi:hypothetical protein
VIAHCTDAIESAGNDLPEPDRAIVRQAVHGFRGVLNEAKCKAMLRAMEAERTVPDDFAAICRHTVQVGICPKCGTEIGAGGDPAPTDNPALCAELAAFGREVVELRRAGFWRAQVIGLSPIGLGPTADEARRRLLAMLRQRGPTAAEESPQPGRSDVPCP